MVRGMEASTKDTRIGHHGEENSRVQKEIQSFDIRRVRGRSVFSNGFSTAERKEVKGFNKGDKRKLQAEKELIARFSKCAPHR